jgi:hypothetical protein
MSDRAAVVSADWLALDSIWVAPIPVKVYHVSKECVAPLFYHEKKKHQVPPKYRLILTTLQSVINQKTAFVTVLLVWSILLTSLTKSNSIFFRRY